MTKTADEITALRAENEELHRQQRAVINAVPSHYLLDPPDGGDVKLHEGVQRMAAEVERLRAALGMWQAAVKIDVKMQGPQYSGVRYLEGRAAWEATRAALEKKR